MVNDVTKKVWNSPQLKRVDHAMVQSNVKTHFTGGPRNCLEKVETTRTKSDTEKIHSLASTIVTMTTMAMSVTVDTTGFDRTMA